MSLVDPLLNQTLDSVYSSVRNAYGKETLSLVYENIPCRWQFAKLREISGVAEVLDYRVVVWLQPMYEDIMANYIIQQGTEKYKISRIEKNYNLEGQLDHVVLYLF